MNKYKIKAKGFEHKQIVSFGKLMVKEEDGTEITTSTHPQPILCSKGRRCSWGICSISVRIGEEIDEGTKLLRPTGSGDPFGRDTGRRGKWKIELDTVSKRTSDQRPLFTKRILLFVIKSTINKRTLRTKGLFWLAVCEDDCALHSDTHMICWELIKR